MTTHDHSYTFRIIIILLIILLTFTACAFKSSGIDDYLNNPNHSQVELTNFFLYSSNFVKKYNYLDADYQYYDTGIFGGDYYEVAILYLTYSPDIYAQAKKDIIDNTDFVSDAPEYSYNGYEFYRINIRVDSDDWKNWFVMNSFNDEKHTIIAMGFSGEPSNKFQVSQSEWPEFLKTYYGDFYDFSK